TRCSACSGVGVAFVLFLSAELFTLSVDSTALSTLGVTKFGTFFALPCSGDSGFNKFAVFSATLVSLLKALLLFLAAKANPDAVTVPATSPAPVLRLLLSLASLEF